MVGEKTFRSGVSALNRLGSIYFPLESMSKTMLDVLVGIVLPGFIWCLCCVVGESVISGVLLGLAVEGPEGNVCGSGESRLCGLITCGGGLLSSKGENLLDVGIVAALLTFASKCLSETLLSEAEGLTVMSEGRSTCLLYEIQML